MLVNKYNKIAMRKIQYNDTHEKTDLFALTSHW